jgi:hypothetical protein
VLGDGPLDMRLNNIINVREPSNRSDASTKNYVDRSTLDNDKLDGSTVMGGSLNMGRNTITNLEDSSDAHDAVNKQHVDNNISHASAEAQGNVVRAICLSKVNPHF